MAVWDPFREMEELRRELDHRLADLSSGRRAAFGRTAFLPGYAARQYPLVNVYEDKDNLYVEALAPGVNPESFDLSVLGTTLTISGEKVAASVLPAHAYHRSERSAGKFVRTVDLPSTVRNEDITATYKQGLLLVMLPKHEAAKPKQITVSVG